MIDILPNLPRLSPLPQLPPLPDKGNENPEANSSPATIHQTLPLGHDAVQLTKTDVLASVSPSGQIEAAASRASPNSANTVGRTDPRTPSPPVPQPPAAPLSAHIKAQTEAAASQLIRLSSPSTSTAGTLGVRRSRLIFGMWKLGATVGCGSSGSVRKAKHTPTGKMCVVKCVRREREVANRPLLRNADGICHKELFMLREALVGVLLDHPNIIQMHSFFIGRRHFYFFYEYIPGLDLSDYIETHGRLDENTGRFVFRQLLDAVDYMHRSNVIHRDLKLENMRYDPVSSRLILLDFGFSTFYSPNFSQRSTCGSPCYASPEIYSSAPYKGPEVDIWAMGVCLYGILVGELPFDHDSFKQLKILVMKGAVRYPDFLSEDARDLIGHMLKLDPIQRATARDIRFSHWLSSPASARTSSLYRPRNFPSTDMVTPEWIDTVLGLERLKRAEAILAELRRRAPQRRAQLEAQWGGTVVVGASSPVGVNRLASEETPTSPEPKTEGRAEGQTAPFESKELQSASTADASAGEPLGTSAPDPSQPQFDPPSTSVNVPAEVAPAAEESRSHFRFLTAQAILQRFTHGRRLTVGTRRDGAGDGSLGSGAAADGGFGGVDGYRAVGGLAGGGEAAGEGWWRGLVRFPEWTKASREWWADKLQLTMGRGRRGGGGGGGGGSGPGQACGMTKARGGSTGLATGVSIDQGRDGTRPSPGEGRAEAGIIHMDSMDDFDDEDENDDGDACSFEEIGSERDKENNGPNSTTARQRLRMGMNLRRAMWRGEL
ncbi:kinase-like domain-containing protein [Zopfochytrium polystomum]|nr:kinase-like domain-containing protein [Zopfochytrium polystomum]